MRFLIVGAGISGCVCAYQLSRSRHEVVLIEKGRGVGGRMATRRMNGARIDHGAQFMTIRSARMKSLLSLWEGESAVIPWYDRIPGHPEIPIGIRYRGTTGMTDPAKYLSRFFDKELNFFVERIERVETGWKIWERQGQFRILNAEHLILAIPSVQILELLHRSSLYLPDEVMNGLKKIRHTRCIALMGLMENSSQLPKPGTFTHPVEEIDWISDNQLKGISSKPCFTIHASDDYSQQLWDAPDEERVPKLLEVGEDCLGTKITQWVSHRWGFAKPTVTFGSSHWHSAEWALTMVGDGFGGERIENAALSGWDGAESILQTIQNL